MRKIKTKKEKAKKKRDLIGFKNRLLKESCIVDMESRLSEELGKAFILIGLSAIYLRKHRKAWDVGDAYLKPYLKGLLTKTANLFEEFSNERLKEGFLERNLEQLDRNVVEGIIGGTSHIKAKVKNERDYNIFEPFVLGSVCIGAVKEKLNWIANYDKVLANRIREIFKGYDRYMQFWTTEIDTFNVDFVRGGK